MIELYDHQKKLLSNLRRGFNQGHAAQMLYAPCGAGKTVIAAAMMSAVVSRGMRVTMLVDITLLAHQTSARLEQYGLDHGLIMPESPRWRPEQPIQVAMIQTIEARRTWPATDLLIIDEAHSLRASVIEFINSRPKMEVVGLSGSPFTKGLGKVYTNVVSGITVNELVAEEKLIYPKIFIAKPIDMTGAKKSMGEWSDKEVTERGAKITGDIVAEWQSKTMEIFGKPAKTIMFCAGIDHGAESAAKFNEAGFNFISLSHKSDPAFRAEAIAEFSKTDSSIDGLVACELLVKGFDVADVSIMISARPYSKSFSSHVQQLGRIMRTHLLKDSAILLDHAGNFLRFRDQWDALCADGVSDLDDGAEKTKPEPTEKEKERAKCPKCNALWPGQADTCPHCGYVRPIHSKIVEVAGEMMELTGKIEKKEKYSSAYMEQWYQATIYYLKINGKNIDRAYYLYREKFNVAPAWKKIAVEPSIELLGEVRNYVRYANTKFSHRRAA